MRIQKFITHALLSRFMILCLDLTLCVISVYASTLLRFNFNLPDEVNEAMPFTCLYVLAVRFFPFFILKTYAGLIKFTGEQDARLVLRSVSFSTGFFLLVYLVLRSYQFGDKLLFFYPISIILIDYVILCFMLVTYRVAVKMVMEEVRTGRKEGKSLKKNAAIFGAGKTGVLIKKAFDSNLKSNLKITAWFDDNPLVVNKVLEGIRIFDAKKDFKELVIKKNIDTVILSMQKIAPWRKKEFIDLCLELNVNMMYAPNVNNWLEDEFNVKELKKFKIEDVLEREPIVLDTRYLEIQLEEKVILITGAAGSIGSEIVRQLSNYKPSKLILVDLAESPLVDLGLEIEENLNFKNLVSIVADVSNQERMNRIFEDHKPDIIYHAAAYKHVPMMENTPYEAIRVNVLGTKTIADLAVKHKVERFVMISTDKAVNPTNVMGCSKRVAEIYIQSLNNHLKEIAAYTRFITTRFGNVLGSNGSVIPRFQKQIEAGGPITVTDQGITRFFMTIPEACQLVLEAGAMGKGGEIFIFDMGKPVKIVDLAEKMIRLSGLIPYNDIDIVFTGLRPGEKLEEELLAKKENILPTHHQKIMKAKVREYNFLEVKAEIEELLKIWAQQDDLKLVSKMKMLVPEYVSNNSLFEKLDQKETPVK
jgi:FlaA1/EpsC-like NDP-sugar epimerase